MDGRRDDDDNGHVHGSLFGPLSEIFVIEQIKNWLLGLLILIPTDGCVYQRMPVSYPSYFGLCCLMKKLVYLVLLILGYSFLWYSPGVVILAQDKLMKELVVKI